MKLRYFVLLNVSIVSVVLCTSCSGKKDDVWTSPPDEAAFGRLENASLKSGIPDTRRAELFFLFGQELSAKVKQSSGSAEMRDKAIGAFERVVDLDTVLVNESRYNLEILYRENDQESQQESKDQQNNKDQSKDGQQKDGQQKDGQQKDGQQKDGQQKDGQQKDAGVSSDQNKSKDLSSLVREKDQSSVLENALKMENTRRAEKQILQAGKIVPVEKDW